MTERKNRICLWYNGTGEEAAQFYAATFPDTAITHIQRSPTDYPDGKQGDVLVVELTVMGIPTILLNGGPQYPQNQAFSFQVLTDSQEETDRYWNAIVGNGGAENQCGWCQDKWGLSWQITPRILMDVQAGPDKAAGARAFQAMLGMKKIDIAAIEAAIRG